MHTTMTFEPPTDTARPGPGTIAADSWGTIHPLADHGADDRERHDPHCASPATLSALLAPSPWQRLVVLGDSIAQGVGDPADGYLDIAWSDRLANALRADGRHLAYLNLGVRGVRAAAIRNRQLERALAFAPDLAVVSAGPNDMLARSFDVDHVTAELDTIVGSLSAQGCVVVTFGLFDLSRTSLLPEALRPGLRGRLVELNIATCEITRRHGGVHVDFFDHPALDDTLFSADLLHPNRRGHAIIATSVAEALTPRAAALAVAHAVATGALNAPRRAS